jgi:IS30 family transposase
MAEHKRFTLATDIKVYFCDPQHPWQRGSNENTNGLLRQYFPKGMDLSTVHQNRLNAVARRLNERPRETLNFETPAVSRCEFSGRLTDRCGAKSRLSSDLCCGRR